MTPYQKLVFKYMKTRRETKRLQHQISILEDRNLDLRNERDALAEKLRGNNMLRTIGARLQIPQKQVMEALCQFLNHLRKGKHESDSDTPTDC